MASLDAHIGAVLKVGFGTNGLEATTTHDDSRFLTMLTLRDPGTTFSVSVADEDNTEQKMVHHLELGMDALRRDARQRLGLDSELTAALENGRQAGRAEMRRELENWVDGKRSRIDGSLPPGLADVLDHLRGH